MSREFITCGIVKYTRLLGRKVEIFATSGQLIANMNLVQPHFSVVNGITVLEEFSLIKLPKPIARAKENDLYFQVHQQDGIVIAKFRIKFISVDDLKKFSDALSSYVTVALNQTLSRDFSTASIDYQCFSQSNPDVSEISQKTDSAHDIFSQPSILSQSMGTVKFNSQPNMQFFPPMDSSQPIFPLSYSHRTSSSDLEHQMYLSQTQTLNSTGIQKVTVDAETQTENRATLKDCLERDDILEEMILKNLSDPKFHELIEKSYKIINHLYTGGSN